MVNNEFRRVLKLDGSNGSEQIERVRQEGVDATVKRMEKDRVRMMKKAEQARRERDELMGVLSPADQNLITTLENTHVTLSEFQKMHGLEPDGIMGPRTQALIADLEYKRRNNAEIERLADAIQPSVYGKFKATPKPCTVRAYARDIDGNQLWERCDKGPHDRHQIPHGATFHDALGGEFRVRWGHDGDGFFQLARDGNWASFHESQWRKDALYTFAAEARHTSINRPQQFMQVRAPEPTSTEVTKVVGTNPFADDVAAVMKKPSRSPKTPDVSKVMVPTLGKKKPEKMTREKYRTTFEQMQYSVIQNLFWGYTVIVSLARGGTWTYRRPTRAWAERTGARRLKRELTKLTLMYERDNPSGVTAKELGVHFPMTTDEVTEMLAKSDTAERDRQQAEWDAEFKGGTS
ncbi:hypothetical protein SEA_MAGRITTE_128 [Microbacterium phage Magritte]|nr:hypothetical protein SEA_MAGRITTE_128 [Microbacterium phage Magritte]